MPRSAKKRAKKPARESVHDGLQQRVVELEQLLTATIAPPFHERVKVERDVALERIHEAEEELAAGREGYKNALAEMERRHALDMAEARKACEDARCRCEYLEGIAASWKASAKKIGGKLIKAKR